MTYADQIFSQKWPENWPGLLSSAVISLSAWGKEERFSRSIHKVQIAFLPIYALLCSRIMFLS